jgi:simple sugar transport system ATP-binding protein
MSSQLRAVASAGVAVLLISTELEEILDLADRIVVISNGRIVGQMQRGDIDLAELGLMMSGASG